MRGRGASTTFFISHFEFSTGIFIWKEMTLSLNVTPLATRRWWPLIFPAYFKFPALSKSFNDDTLCTYTFPNRGQRTRAKVQGTSCSLYFVWNRSFDCVKYLLGTNMLLMRNSKNHQSFLYTFYFSSLNISWLYTFLKGWDCKHDSSKDSFWIGMTDDREMYWLCVYCCIQNRFRITGLEL